MQKNLFLVWYIWILFKGLSWTIWGKNSKVPSTIIVFNCVWAEPIWGKKFWKTKEIITRLEGLSWTIWGKKANFARIYLSPISLNWTIWGKKKGNKPLLHIGLASLSWTIWGKKRKMSLRPPAFSEVWAEQYGVKSI